MIEYSIVIVWEEVVIRNGWQDNNSLEVSTQKWLAGEGGGVVGEGGRGGGEVGGGGGVGGREGIVGLCETLKWIISA